MEAVFAHFVQVRVLFRPRRKSDATVSLPVGATVGDLLAAVQEGSDSTLAVRGSTPIPEGEALVDGEEILLLSAFSGG
jgi:sulfur carrier protein ThiS